MTETIRDKLRRMQHVPLKIVTQWVNELVLDGRTPIDNLGEKVLKKTGIFLRLQNTNPDCSRKKYGICRHGNSIKVPISERLSYYWRIPIRPTVLDKSTDEK